MALPVPARKISYRAACPTLIVEKKKCATCGNLIESELFLEGAGEYFHEACWAKTNRERLGPLVKSKIEQRSTAIQEHWRYLKRFLVFTAIICAIFLLEMFFFQPSNLWLLISTFLTLCVLIAAPIQIVHVLREIRKKKKEMQRLDTGVIF